MSLEIGRVIDGKYRVLRHAGGGGMGDVFVAADETLGRQVALKVIREGAVDETFRARFAREARVLAQIGPPHAVTIYAHGVEPDGLAWIAMELLEGETLGDRLRRDGLLGPAELAPIFTGLLEAVAALHAKEIVHRDLKPDNVFLLRDAKAPAGVSVRLLDFGIAKFDLAGDLTMTHAGMGTPMYAAPEQLGNARSVDGRADVYSLAAVLYECLVGELPYAAESLSELVMRMYTEGPRPARSVGRDVPAALGELADAGLVVDPAGRIPDVATFAARFAEALAPTGEEARLGMTATALGSVPSPTPMPAPTPTPAPAPMPTPTPAHAPSSRPAPLPSPHPRGAAQASSSYPASPEPGFAPHSQVPPEATPEAKRMATYGVATGIVGLGCCCFPVAIVAIALGLRARKLARESGTPAPATAGIALGLGALGLVVGIFVAGFALQRELHRRARIGTLESQVAGSLSSPTLEQPIACALAEMRLLRDGLGSRSASSVERFDCPGRLTQAGDAARLDDTQVVVSGRRERLDFCFRRGAEWHVTSFGVHERCEGVPESSEVGAPGEVPTSPPAGGGSR